MLKRFFPAYKYHSIEDIEVDFFQSHNIKYVILDIDNTLVPYTCPNPNEYALAFLSRMQKEGIDVCFVSNNNKHRVEKFNANLKRHSVWRANKPFTRSIKKAMNLMNAMQEETALIGDQVFTDVYGGNRAKITTILVDPIESKESTFFKAKRRLEKWVLNHMTKE